MASAPAPPPPPAAREDKPQPKPAKSQESREDLEKFAADMQQKWDDFAEAEKRLSGWAQATTAIGSGE